MSPSIRLSWPLCLLLLTAPAWSQIKVTPQHGRSGGGQASPPRATSPAPAPSIPRSTPAPAPAPHVVTPPRVVTPPQVTRPQPAPIDRGNSGRSYQPPRATPMPTPAPVRNDPPRYRQPEVGTPGSPIRETPRVDSPRYQPPVRVNPIPGGGVDGGSTWTPPGSTRRAIGGGSSSGGRSYPQPDTLAPGTGGRDRYRAGIPDQDNPVRVTPRSPGEGRGPAVQPPRGIDGSLADRYRTRLDKDRGTPAPDLGGGNTPARPGRDTLVPSPGRGDTRAPVIGAPGAGHRYPGVRATPRDTVVGEPGTGPGRGPVASPAPRPALAPIVVPHTPPTPGPGSGLGGSRSFRDWSVSPSGHSVRTGVDLGCAWGSRGHWARWGAWYPTFGWWGFWSPYPWYWYSSCHSYYSFCYSGWPSYWSRCWTPVWCRPWWCSPWWWDYCTSWDFAYGYHTVVVQSEPSVVVVRETTQQPAEVISTESLGGGAPAREPVASAPATSPSVLTAKYVKLGDQYFTEGRYQQASESYLRALGYAPDDGSIHFVLADALFALGDYHYAAYVIRKGVELEPDLARSDVDKRKFYGREREKDFDKHMASLRDYIDDHPYDAAAQVVLGYNLLFTREVTASERAFRRVLELDPENAAARRFLDAIAARRLAERRGEPASQPEPLKKDY